MRRLLTKALLFRTYCAATLSVAALFTAGCGGEPGTVTILAVNDVYRIAGVDGGGAGSLARVRQLRAELERQAPDLLLLHGGDFLFPSPLSRRYGGAQMIDVMNLLDGDQEGFDERFFVAFGNHEFDADAALLEARIGESQFAWVGSNLEWSGDGARVGAIDPPLVIEDALLESGGTTVGMFSLTADFGAPDWVAFEDLEGVARERTTDLRQRGAELVVALTHLPWAADLDLLETLGADGPDLVIGGHDHHRLDKMASNGRRVVKADSDAVTAAVVRVTPRRGEAPEVAVEYHLLDAGVGRDPEVESRAAEWLDRFDREHCASLEREPGCLDEVVGHSTVELVGEEVEIRSYETNLGNWLADVARDAYASSGAQIAFLNSGGMRLHQDLPPGSVELRHIEELFQYPSELVLLEIDGRTLQQIAEHAVTGWPSHGKWLQISGFAFRHEPEDERAYDLTLLSPEGPRPVSPDEKILAVTNTYLASPETGQDGYSMIGRDMWRLAEGISLRERVVEALAAAGEAGIAPRVEGRICAGEGECLVNVRRTLD